jgi:hypothetical protein
MGYDRRNGALGVRVRSRQDLIGYPAQVPIFLPCESAYAIRVGWLAETQKLRMYVRMLVICGACRLYTEQFSNTGNV